MRMMTGVIATVHGLYPFEVSPEIEGPRCDSGPCAGVGATRQKTGCIAGTNQTSASRSMEPRPKNREEEVPQYNFPSPRNQSSFSIKENGTGGEPPKGYAPVIRTFRPRALRPSRRFIMSAWDGSRRGFRSGAGHGPCELRSGSHAPDIPKKEGKVVRD